MALAIALVMCMSVMGTTAFAAVNITVNRDDTTYTDGDGDTSESGNRTYTYYQIFRATETGNHTSSGGGYDSDGTPGDVTTTPEKGISYYLNSTDTTQVNALGTWNDTSKTWTKATGNEWFKLTKSADGTQYIVTWDNDETDSDTVQEAAQWLKDNYTALTSDTLTAATDGKSWTAENLDEGYYLLKGETGQNLIAATADITVNEKNSYPTVDKKQNDATPSDYKDDAVNVKVGDTIYYQVTVKVPADAQGDITVADTPSAGLTYDSTTGVTVTVGDTIEAAAEITNTGDANYKAESAASGQAWKYTIHATDATKGKYVVFTFQATVNNDALVQTDRKNDVAIDYGNYHQEDTVEHDLGAAAIIKYDGATASVNATSKELEKASTADEIKYLEATFTLTDGTNPVNVTKVSDGVYKVDTASESNSVTSDKARNGVILIYGLDPDVTYKLTETATESGYNLMDGTADLSVTALDNSGKNATKVTVAEASGVYAGDNDAAADNTFELTATAVGKIANNQGSVLPSTGGIGTTIFYVIGAVLVIGAGVLLVTRRRMRAE